MSNIPDNDDSQHKLTPSDIAGFANTIEAIRNSDLIPEHEISQFVAALDSIAGLTDDTCDPLTFHALNAWLPELLPVSKQGKVKAESKNEHVHVTETSEAAHITEIGEGGYITEDLLDRMRRIISEIADYSTSPEEDDGKAINLVRLLNIIYNCDDEDGPFLTSIAMEYAYDFSKHHYESMQEFMSEALGSEHEAPEHSEEESEQ
jgi:hypothetical protein